MKQPIIFSIFAALLALSVVSCREDQITPYPITLHAVIQTFDNDSKVYINDPTPYWHRGDQIRINDADYTLQTVMENSAPIPNVVICTSGYRAIFPVGILNNGDANLNSSSSVDVTLPVAQAFEMMDSRQRVEVPMGAFVNSSTLQFHNLCSVVRVYVCNTTNAQLPVTSITLTAESAYLSGAGTATITGDSTDAIVIPSATGSHSVTLCKIDNTPMKTIKPLSTKYFDVIVPEFSTPNDLTVSVFTSTGNKTITIEDVTLAHNTITTITVNVDELPQTTAELVDGQTFNAAIPTNVRAICFEYNKAFIRSNTILSTAASPYPIYGSIVGTTWVVSTPANSINANADCQKMFKGRTLTSIDFGDNFNTSNVTDMGLMFAGCRFLTSLDLSNFNTSNVMDMGGMFYGCYILTSLDLSNFNTANVTNMASMFDSCYRLTSLDLSSFNTTNVNNMQGMFYGCSYLTSLNLYNFDMSGLTDHSFNGQTYTGKYNMCYGLAWRADTCAIICPTAVQTELQNGTDLVNSCITWYTH